MDEKLYYEAEVKYGDDVRKVYDAAVERNAKFYRGISVSGKYFGWADGKFVHAEEGQEWFENPCYKNIDEAEEKPLEEVESKEVPLSDEIESEQPITEEGFEAAAEYEARIAELEQAISERDALLAEKTTLLAENADRLEKLENAVKYIIDFIKEV